MTPRELLRQAACRLREAGVPDPEVDGALLLSHLTGQPPLALRLDSEHPLPDDVLDDFQSLLAQRLRRVPLQYLTGEVSFLGQVFHVDSRVLIPRPETELLAERAIAALRGFPAPASALDLCCGSGCLGLSLALAVPTAQVTLTDLSPAALDVARANAARSGAQASFLQGDLFAPVAGRRYHMIVSNPPYIPTAECAGLQAEVRQEPAMALDGGADGMAFYRRIAAEALAHLHPGGTLLLEVGWDQGEAVRRLLAEAGFQHTAAHLDWQNIPRMVEGHAPEAKEHE